MAFNPFKNRSFLNPIFIFIISLVLQLLGYKEFSQITFILSILWGIIYIIVGHVKKRNKKNRHIEFVKYIKRTGNNYLDSFDQPIRDGIAMSCFSSMEGPVFYDVIITA